MSATIAQELIDSAKGPQKSIEHDDLLIFLEAWDYNYINEIKKIDLFNADVTKTYTDRQKEYFTRTFYHIRGHFYKFLWLLGNQAPNKKAKEQILYNIEEEFGGDSPSHEQLYLEFSKSLGLDITDEFISEEHHLPFIKKFNTGHLEWLTNNDWLGKWSAFSAYERLDNIDYANLLSLARSFGVTGNALTFFIIHNKADHFDRKFHGQKYPWSPSMNKVKDAFDFIGKHQINMWKTLSRTISQQ